MARAHGQPGWRRLALAALLASLSAAQAGCSLATRSQVAECRRFSQEVRAENARLKDQVLALRTQNEDYAERAVDDGKRLARLEDANRELETSVVAFQEDRSQLEAAYQELRANLPGAPQTQLSLRDNEKDTPPEVRPVPRSKPIPRSPTRVADRGEDPGTDPIAPEDDPPRPRAKESSRGTDRWIPSGRSPARPIRQDEPADVGAP
ncbi:hypothetical protein [Aquisphaera insulae]|uniref:hypothetical protein n=1 Tax=Aquisphaera insulae TaxID=2712864 RepID=UPI0013ECAB4F|nr:hypothetical protein [Aquisphaera insulae]